jgi:hypothetical protein
MTTNLKRATRGQSVPKRTLMLLGLGAGMNAVPDRNLKRLWRRYGEQVTAYWRANYGREPFMALIAREEGWDTDEA